MPSVNQHCGVMHGRLGNINCFHLTLLPAHSHLFTYVCVYVRACVCVRALGMHTQADPSSSPTLIEVDVPLLFGGSTEGPLLTGQRRVLIELF